MGDSEFQLLRERIRGREQERDRVWRLLEAAMISEERPEAKAALVALAYKVVDP